MCCLPANELKIEVIMIDGFGRMSLSSIIIKHEILCTKVTHSFLVDFNIVKNKYKWLKLLYETVPHSLSVNISRY